MQLCERTEQRPEIEGSRNSRGRESKEEGTMEAEREGTDQSKRNGDRSIANWGI